MHSSDPNKDDAEFQAEFERILKEAGTGTADLSYFVFPSANYGEREFTAQCWFAGAKFPRGTLFYRTKFAQRAVFGGAAFMEDSSFWQATFTQDAEFTDATFAKDAEFEETNFVGKARFSGASFAGGATFWKARFMRGALFGGVNFAENADFGNALVTEDAIFNRATFAGPASFVSAEFMGVVAFVQTTFRLDANFTMTTFAQRAEFRFSAFEGPAIFRETRFRDDNTLSPGPVFSNTRFDKPTAVTFLRTFLGQAIFRNCDMSMFVLSDIRWRERSSNGKRMLFEEVADPEDEALGAIVAQGKGSGSRNYGLIAEIYQQLKKNYDDKRDYWTAGDFHYGEMEMKRLATPQPNRLSRWLKNIGLAGPRFEVSHRRWHRNVGLAALYKYASEYGESYNVPILWLAGFLFLFMFLYPILGLHPTLKVGGVQAAAHDPLSRDAGVPELSYRNYIHYASLQPGGERLSFPALLGHSLMTSVGVAALQRDLAYEPSYPWGRVLSWLELALTSTLIALFLLAVRRQFQR
jgi:hypothetical protein